MPRLQDINVKYLAITPSSSTDKGLIMSGDSEFNSNVSINANLAVTNNLTVGGNTTITGNLTVVGTTSKTTIQSVTTVYQDPILQIGGTTAPESDDGNDRGVSFLYYDTVAEAAKTGFMGYDNDADGFIFKTDATISGEEVSGTNSNITCGVLTAVLTNCTGLPAAQVLQGTMASGMVLVAPVLGTPASGDLTNCTSLPAAQVSQGTMTSGMVLVAPVLGTPASGDLSNCTGTAAGLTAGLVTNITINTTDAGTVAIGTTAGAALTEGLGNVAIGYQSLDAAIVSDNNTAIGHQSLSALASNNETGNNVAVGYQAGLILNHTTSAVDNVLIGSGAGVAATTLGSSVIIGKGAVGTGTTLTAADGSVAIGAGAAAALTIGLGTTVVGFQAGAALTEGLGNTAIGYQSLLTEAANGDQNTAIGYQTLKVMAADTNTHGQNTALGYHAGVGLTFGIKNTIIGALAGTADITGDSNTIVGHDAGDVITSGTLNTIIGDGANPSAAGASNQTVIGQGTTGISDNSVVLGNASVTDVFMASDKGAAVHCTHLSVGCKRFSSYSVSLAGLTAEISDDDVIQYLGKLDVSVPTGFQAVSKIVIERVVIGVTAAVAGTVGAANLQLGTADDDVYNAAVTNKLEIVGAGVESHYGGANVIGGVNVDQSITEIDINLNTSADTILYYVPHLEVPVSKPYLYLCAGEGSTTTYDAGRFNIMVEYLVL